MATHFLSSKREIIHANQRARMIGPEPNLASLHHLHLQVLSVLLPALVSIRRRRVVHAGQRIRIH